MSIKHAGAGRRRSAAAARSRPPPWRRTPQVPPVLRLAPVIEAGRTSSVRHYLIRQLCRESRSAVCWISVRYGRSTSTVERHHGEEEQADWLGRGRSLAGPTLFTARARLSTRPGTDGRYAMDFDLVPAAEIRGSEPFDAGPLEQSQPGRRRSSWHGGRLFCACVCDLFPGERGRL